MKIITSLLLVFFTSLTFAQEYQVDLDYYLPDDVSYDSSIPTPKSVIGHEVGDWHITHDKLAQYMTALAASSDRITIENRGSTFEGRPILLLTITSPSNHASIETIRENHVALTNANAGALNTSEMPLVVYQGFSIHGNE
ncbi:MAG: zinc carboxypeptidase, partial [Flavobacteriaceae bacterium]|nr:zinc carboxypeptidase [Flavobacteriaceae bacterium]